MHTFALSKEVIRDFPEAQVRFVVAEGLRNNEVWPETVLKRDELFAAVESGAWIPFTETDQCILSWHEAYRKFGTNPRRFRPSLDALSRRFAKSGRLPSINSAVDAYNFISVKHGTPAGAFDLNEIESPVSIRHANPGDIFTPLGEPDEVETPSTGEVVYAEENRVLTRHWNYRDSDFTKVTENSRNVIFIIERIAEGAVSSSAMAAAQKELAELVRPHAETVRMAVIEAETPLTKLSEKEPGFAI